MMQRSKCPPVPDLYAGAAALRKFACGRDDLALVAAQGERRAHQFETSERDDILDRSTLDRHGSPEDTFLGGTDPRSRPTLEASRADRHVGRKSCQRPDGRAEQRKAPAHAGLGLADPAGGAGE
jgi:hypothetical protein